LPKHVLTVEASPDIALLLRIVLEDAGYAVQWAGDLLTARTVAAGPFPPDLVILEPGLPDGDGLDFYRHLKTTYPAIPVIVLTSWLHGPTLRDEVLAGGSDVFMTKPFDVDRLTAEARRLLADREDREGTRGTG
jgi:DNA-binding response OmpR family regulator